MKLDPGFATHWKTERLIEQLGAEGIVVLLRIWGQAQIRREWQGLKWTPKRLAMETKWKACENHLWQVLTDPDAPWLDVAEDGTVSIHDFEEHQKQVIHLWSAGGKGGRPKKVSPAPSSKKEENTSPSSSSYPIGFSNENQMVSEHGETKPLCTLKQALSHAPTARMTPEQAEYWWHTRNGAGWTKGSAGGGAPRKITSWQSDMATSAGWIAESFEKAKSNGNNSAKPKQFIDEP